MKVLILATNEVKDFPVDSYANRLIEQGKAVLPPAKKKAEIEVEKSEKKRSGKKE